MKIYRLERIISVPEMPSTLILSAHDEMGVHCGMVRVLRSKRAVEAAVLGQLYRNPVSARMGIPMPNSWE